MNLRIALLAVLACAAIGAASACQTSGSTTPMTNSYPPRNQGPLYGNCTVDSDCQSGLCLNIAPPTSMYASNSCSQPCSGTCPSGGGCGTAPDGSKKCLPSCNGDEMGEYVCTGGIEVPCQLADPSRCDVCGCPSALRCIVGQGCAPKSDVGGPCTADSDCKTDNCSMISAVCRVPVGQPCTQEDCDLCMSNGAGYSFCSRDCQSDQDCNGNLCLGYPLQGFSCGPKCSSSCPGQCMYTSDGSEQYCDCASCTTAASTRSLGESVLERRRLRQRRVPCRVPHGDMQRGVFGELGLRERLRMRHAAVRRRRRHGIVRAMPAHVQRRRRRVPGRLLPAREHAAELAGQRVRRARERGKPVLGRYRLSVGPLRVLQLRPRRRRVERRVLHGTRRLRVRQLHGGGVHGHGARRRSLRDQRGLRGGDVLPVGPQRRDVRDVMLSAPASPRARRQPLGTRGRPRA